MLDVTVELEAPDPYEPAAWLGVDLGVVNIATTRMATAPPEAT